MMRRLVGLAAFVVCGCFAAANFEPLPPGGHHVLFVGNSLTYVNDLPNTLVAIAAAAGDTIRVASAAGANLALIDHLTGSTDAPQLIAGDRWEFVILQQGPTPAGICRDSLVLWSKLFEPRIRAAGAQPALLMTWPGATFQYLWDDVRVSFQNAATAVSGTFMPAGEAWRAAWTADPSLQLYGPDGFHPSPAGTFLTALEIYERVTGKDARSLPARAFSNGEEISLPVETIRLLQRAAHDANVRFPARSSSLAAPARLLSAGATSC
jgi:hypothetical protein